VRRLGGGVKLAQMGNCLTIVPYYQHPIPTRFTTYRGAGMIFDNGSTILCGYEPPKKHPALYGIGGKRETTDANYRETAAREMLEEMFGLQTIPRNILQRVLVIVPQEETMVDGYVMLRYRFSDLVCMMLTLRDQKSPFYRTMPVTVSDLVLGRRLLNHPVETSHLCLLPMISPAPNVSEDLADDIRRLLSKRTHIG
jgi:hypothetical protein